jgi:sarcosine oxidase
MRGVRDVDVVVVGTGVLGAAAGWNLARAGREVVLLERFSVGHPRGSSHGHSRVVRYSYGNPEYVRMMAEAFPLWRELEEEAGETLLTVTGGLDMGGEAVSTNAAALEAAGVPFEIIDGKEAVARYPVLSVPPEERFLFQGDTGIVAADRAWRAFAAAAVHRGADLREETPVVEIRSSSDRAEVVTDAATYRARAVIVTAGSWARDLLGAIGVDLPVTPTRETVAYYEIGDGPLPVFIEWLTPAIYALPSPGEGLKVAEHHAGPQTDPDEDGSPSAASLERLRAWMARRFPAAAETPLRVETCIYTNTADERFVVERHGRVVVGSACSGHGFKFAPLTGVRLGRLAAEALT